MDEKTYDVPTRIFEEYVKALEAAGLSIELIKRLRKTLIQDKLFTERAIKEAVLGEENLDD